MAKCYLTVIANCRKQQTNLTNHKIWKKNLSKRVFMIDTLLWEH